MSPEKIRESVIAGSWYPGDAETLKREINNYLGQVKVAPPKGNIVGLAVPHAGYRYSGAVAAHAYKLLFDQPFERVLIVAPSHRAYFEGASIYTLGGYRTPLGVVPLDKTLVDTLMRQPIPVDYVARAHSEEHSLEIQLPFLQVVLKEFKLTPVVMGDQSYSNCIRLADAIAAVCRDEKVLLVASTDLSHFHSHDAAKRLDDKVLERVAGFDPAGLAEDLRSGKCEACGGGPLMTIMHAARKLGAGKAKVLRYANSGDVTGDSSNVVGYMAAVFYADSGSAKSSGKTKTGKVGVDLDLSEEEKNTLRELAFKAIRSRCFGEPPPAFTTTSAKLQEPRGAFVCIKKAGKLRGCIGMIEAKEPLYKTIKDMAVQAAFSDPRFCSLDPSELADIQVEISVLTPLERIHDAAQIEIGRHGLYLREGRHSGLLLPQVATENDWDREQFLEWTCRKAGLPPRAWKDPEAELYIFSADVF